MIKQYMDTIYAARTHQPLYDSSAPYKASWSAEKMTKPNITLYMYMYKILMYNVQTLFISLVMYKFEYVCLCECVCVYYDTE